VPFPRHQNCSSAERESYPVCNRALDPEFVVTSKKMIAPPPLDEDEQIELTRRYLALSLVFDAACDIVHWDFPYEASIYKRGGFPFLHPALFPYAVR
jgi:hypothetical protein